MENENANIEEMPLSETEGDSLETVSEPMALSDAVVQSLADALTKIETYVPTVWVDNTEPDIDAEHLNHAEQAIMKVTALMNGAVDVIQDLQSQVTTLNNNYQLAEKAVLFIAGSGDPAKEYLRVYDSPDTLHQLVLTGSGFTFDSYDGSKWKTDWVGVTNSDLEVKSTAVTNDTCMENNIYLYKTGRVVFATYTGNVKNIASGSNVLLSLPSDYHPISDVIINPYTSHKNFQIRFSNRGSVELYNYTGTEQSNLQYCRFATSWISLN